MGGVGFLSPDSFPLRGRMERESGQAERRRVVEVEGIGRERQRGISLLILRVTKLGDGHRRAILSLTAEILQMWATLNPPADEEGQEEERGASSLLPSWH